MLGLAEFQGQIAIVSPWMDNGTVMNYISQHADVDRRQLVCAFTVSKNSHQDHSSAVYGHRVRPNLPSPKGNGKRVTLMIYPPFFNCLHTYVGSWRHEGGV